MRLDNVLLHPCVLSLMCTALTRCFLFVYWGLLGFLSAFIWKCALSLLELKQQRQWHRRRLCPHARPLAEGSVLLMFTWAQQVTLCNPLKSPPALTWALISPDYLLSTTYTSFHSQEVYCASWEVTKSSAVYTILASLWWHQQWN